jgi:transcription elongation factor Elf1
MRRRIDLPPTYFYCGPCNGRTVSMQLTADNGMLTYEAETEKCTGSLYALLTSKTVSCRNCGTIYDVATRRQWLLAELEDALLPLRLVWEALPRLVGVQPDWETVRRWPKLTGPRHLDVRGLTTTDVELFRAGDVLALVRRDNRRLPTRLPT